MSSISNAAEQLESAPEKSEYTDDKKRFDEDPLILEEDPENSPVEAVRLGKHGLQNSQLKSLPV